MPMEKKVYDVRVKINFTDTIRVMATDPDEAGDLAIEKAAVIHQTETDNVYVNHTTEIREKGDE